MWGFWNELKGVPPIKKSQAFLKIDVFTPSNTLQGGKKKGFCPKNSLFEDAKSAV
jgi:hypothetical protein